MNNLQIIELAKEFKKKLEIEIEINKYDSDNLQFILWKTLIMTEISLRSFTLNEKIESFETHYFDRQTAVSRHFYDWGLDYVAENYREIDKFIKLNYWPTDS